MEPLHEMLCGAGLEPLSPMMGGMLHTDLYKWLSKYYPEEGHALKPFQGRPFNVLEQFEDLLPRIPKADENDAELERLMNKASKVMYDDTQTQHTRYLALEAVVKRLAFLGPDAPTQPPPASTQPPPPPYRSGFLHILRKLKRPPPPQGARRVIPPPPPPPGYRPGPSQPDMPDTPYIRPPPKVLTPEQILAEQVKQKQIAAQAAHMEALKERLKQIKKD